MPHAVATNEQSRRNPRDGARALAVKARSSRAVADDASAMCSDCSLFGPASNLNSDQECGIS